MKIYDYETGCDQLEVTYGSEDSNGKADSVTVRLEVCTSLATYCDKERDHRFGFVELPVCDFISALLTARTGVRTCIGKPGNRITLSESGLSMQTDLDFWASWGKQNYLSNESDKHDEDQGLNPWSKAGMSFDSYYEVGGLAGLGCELEFLPVIGTIRTSEYSYISFDDLFLDAFSVVENAEPQKRTL